VRLSSEGEFGLIRRIQSLLTTQNDRIIKGIGDDTAVLQPRSGYQILLTTDTMVEGIHFDFAYTPLQDLGWKLMAVNLSDLAAMGGTPLCALFSLGIREDWSVSRLEELIHGIRECSKVYDCPVVGGDTVRTPNDCTLTMTILGEAKTGDAVFRSGAQPGDYLCVTGPLGNARTGLEVLKHGVQDSRYKQAISRFLRPVPRISEAIQLIRMGGISAMIDISDGLSSELGHLCEASHVGCKIEAEQIPVAEEALCWTETRGISTVLFVLESGEEYELLIAIRPEQYEALCTSGEKNRVPLFKIGQICNVKTGLKLSNHNKETEIEARGWNHFNR
jgi:thiamine-monophosphate kinase